MNDKIQIIKKAAIALVALTVIMSLFVFGTGNEYSTEDDPLVSLSYINGVMIPSIENYVDSKIKNVSVDEIADALMQNENFRQYVASIVASSGSGTVPGSAVSQDFIKLELSAGKRVTASGKCEIIVRSGHAAVFCKTEGAVKDLSADKVLKNGDEAPVGDLIVVTYAEGAGISSVYSPTEILIRGEFTVGE